MNRIGSYRHESHGRASTIAIFGLPNHLRKNWIDQMSLITSQDSVESHEKCSKARFWNIRSGVRGQWCGGTRKEADDERRGD
jgi:hypothetical protein